MTQQDIIKAPSLVGQQFKYMSVHQLAMSHYCLEALGNELEGREVSVQFPVDNCPHYKETPSKVSLAGPIIVPLSTKAWE